VKAKIISSDEEFADSLRTELPGFFKELDPDNLVLIDIYYLIDPINRLENKALAEEVWQEAKKSQNIIILLSLKSEASLLRFSPEFAKLIKLPNVGFVSSLHPYQILPKYQRIAKFLRL
jgi:endo-1,4-beta-D-glucanase Y